MYNIIKTKNIWFGVSSIAVMVSIVFLLLGGLKLGIDFTGGSLLRISFDQRPEGVEIEELVSDMDLGDMKTQPEGGQNIILKTKHLSNDEKIELFGKIQEAHPDATEETFESIGPIIGDELKSKAIVAIVIVLLAIIGYISWAFRKVSNGPVKSWAYGVGAIIALFHDILIVSGVFAYLGYTKGIEVDSLFVTALLTILGFSVHDTIVVYDRIRENLKKSTKSFKEIVNESVNQTIIRSLNTSITTLLVLVVLYIFGGETLQSFVLALIIGVVIGTYSSIFIASPLLLLWDKKKSQDEEKLANIK